jgi:hypothetical protein
VNDNLDTGADAAMVRFVGCDAGLLERVRLSRDFANAFFAPPTARQRLGVVKQQRLDQPDGREEVSKRYSWDP